MRKNLLIKNTNDGYIIRKYINLQQNHIDWLANLGLYELAEMKAILYNYDDNKKLNPKPGEYIERFYIWSPSIKEIFNKIR